MKQPRILIAGIGSIFDGDDAFGVEVVRLLAPRAWPEDVRIVDFGIRGLDLTYALLDEPDAAILVDAVPRGGAPGALYVLEIDPEVVPDAVGALMDAHALDPWKVLQTVKSLGGRLQRVYLVGCEPRPLGPDDMDMELSEPVRAALGEAVAAIEALVDKIRGEVGEAAANPV
jgi:hydrogenase maturation protease